MHGNWQDRVWGFVEKGDEEDDHWIWTGPFQGPGQPRIWGHGVPSLSGRRTVWRLVKGESPVAELDLVCDEPRCVNPAHAKDRAIRSHCPEGHAYTVENTRLNETGRQHCRTCERIAARARKAKPSRTKRPPPTRR